MKVDRNLDYARDRLAVFDCRRVAPALNSSFGGEIKIAIACGFEKPHITHLPSIIEPDYQHSAALLAGSNGRQRIMRRMLKLVRAINCWSSICHHRR